MNFILARCAQPGSLEQMKAFYFIPDSARTAAMQLRFALAHHLENMSKPDFVRVWSSIAYLFPGLHPDGFEDADSGWPHVLRRFAAEAWRRADAGELDDAELYPSDAQWSGLYDQIKNPTPDESRRRQKLAELSLECAHA
jgi:hypothetical protein